MPMGRQQPSGRGSPACKQQALPSQRAKRTRFAASRYPLAGQRQLPLLGIPLPLLLAVLLADRRRTARSTASKASRHGSPHVAGAQLVPPAVSAVIAQLAAAAAFSQGGIALCKHETNCAVKLAPVGRLSRGLPAGGMPVLHWRAVLCSAGTPLLLLRRFQRQLLVALLRLAACHAACRAVGSVGGASRNRNVCVVCLVVQRGLCGQRSKSERLQSAFQAASKALTRTSAASDRQVPRAVAYGRAWHSTAILSSQDCKGRVGG